MKPWHPKPGFSLFLLPHGAAQQAGRARILRMLRATVALNAGRNGRRTQRPPDATAAARDGGHHDVGSP